MTTIEKGQTTRLPLSPALRRKRRRSVRIGLLLLSPALALGTLFFVVPVAFVVYQSLTDAPLLGSAKFVGLDNYRKLLADDDFRHAIIFSGSFTLIGAPMNVLIGYALGVLMRGSRRLAAIFRGVYLVPFVVGLATLSYMAVLELQPGYGGVNEVLKGLHITNGGTAWLIQPGLALVAVAVLSTWFSCGLGMILFMTAMQGVPTELIEAARVDGAGWWARERQIIFPLVRRTLALVSITTVSGYFLAFTQFYILTHGGPGTSTSTSVILTYRTALQEFRLGYASAMSMTLLILIATLSVAQFYVFRSNETDR
jgi:multiple sugar transport system permease protein